MSLDVNISDSWKEVEEVDVNVTSSWKLLESAWAKISGTWTNIFTGHTYVPSNMLVLYYDTGHLPATASATSDYNGYYPRPNTTSILGTGGVSTHDSADHGSSSASTTGAVSNTLRVWERTVLSNGYYTTNSSHTHTYGHSHTGSEYHTPPYADLIPTISCKYVGENAIFFMDTATPPVGWSEWTTYNGRYLRLRATPLNSTNYSSHGIDAVNLDTSYHTPTVVQDSYLRGEYFYRHAHGADHSHAAITNEYQWWYLNPVICPSKMYLEELPNGIIGLFTSTSVPTGWSGITDKTGRIIRYANGSNAGLTDGTSTHSHSSSSYTTSGTPGSTIYEYQSDPYEKYATNSSTGHSYNHGHTTAVSWAPPIVNMYFAKKIS